MGETGSHADLREDSGLKTGYEICDKPWRIRDMPRRLRPREEIERLGVEGVSDDLLIAAIIRGGVAGANAVDIARDLLRDYGSLTSLAGASVDELASRRGLGKVKGQVLMAALELARRMSEEALPEVCSIKKPEDVAAILREKTRSIDYETFWVFVLDTRNRLKGRPIKVSSGVLDASLVHPREVFREAIRSAASAVVLGHNHPSGDPSPSAEDLRITRQLVQAGETVEIRVLDHVVMGRKEEGRQNDFLSMREEGIVKFS